jgi:hypothetical protein
MMKRTIVVGVVLALGLIARAEPPVPAPYVRAVDVEDGKRVQLQTAARTFRSETPGMPEIRVAAAVHIGDLSFYQQLQAYLDASDVVLYEGVKPPGAGAHEGGVSPEATDEERIDLTKKRVRLSATLIEAFKRDHDGALPVSLEDLRGVKDKRLAALAPMVATDAWGRALVFRPANSADAKPGYGLVSLGSDGAAGGEGAAGDIAYADLTPVSPDELPGASKGIQRRLADAFGLVFQPEHMDHSKPNWRNSDMSIDQVEARLEEVGADGSMLFKLLDGSSMQAMIAGLVLKFIEASPTMQTICKVILIDTLANVQGTLDSMPGGTGKLMSVIVLERNKVVIDDLKALLAEQPARKSIGIIYGAGHLADLEKRIVELGYRPVEDTWFTAMDVDVTSGGAMTVQQAKSFRESISKAMSRQIEAAKRQGERETAREERRKAAGGAGAGDAKDGAKPEVTPGATPGAEPKK